ncbi:MAG: IS1595 family transposase [bacterium]|nr:IS1595 family transposase [bacterium]
MFGDVIPLPRDDSLPGTLPEFTRKFSSDRACAALLRRWKYGEGGFRCPRCGGRRAWFLPSRRLDECTSCHKQISLTSGTVMHGSRKPLRLWFLAMFLFVVSKQGISAMDLSRQLGISYPTAWTWLHKLRAAVGTRPKTRLHGVVEADETWEGGVEHGHPGRPTVGKKKALIAGAIEVKRKKGWGRLRLQSVESASATSLGAFLHEHVAPGSTLLTDDWRSYRRPAKEAGYKHIATNMKTVPAGAHTVLPGIHRVFALLHRVLLTTHQGAVSRKHLQNYVEEFAFRFNRRRSASRGLLFQRLLSAAVMRSPPCYWEILERPDPDTPLWMAA